MAQDPKQTDQQNKGEVDIDDLEVEIYIIAKNVGSFKQTAAFLTRRGWPTECTSNISKALEHIADRKPDFVLVSFSHPSPAMQKLPDLITQTFNSVCIGFAEDGAGAQRLMQSKLRHKITSHPSGPNIHRTLRRILSEQLNGGTESEKAATRTEEEEENSVTVKGSGERAGVFMQKGEKSTQPNGYNPLNGGGKPLTGLIADGANGYKPLDPSTMDSFGNKVSNVAYMPNQSGGTSGTGSATSGGFGDISGSGMQGGATSSTNGFGSLNGGEEGEDPVANGMESVSSGKYTMGKAKRRSLKDLQGKTRAAEADEGLTLGHPTSVAEAAGLVPPKADPADVINRLKQSLFGEDGDASDDLPSTETPRVPDTPAPSAEALDARSMLHKAAGSALAALCRENPNMTPTNIEMVEKVGVFPVDSSNMPGYLVLALDTLADSDQVHFLRQCEQALKNAFLSMGVQARLEPGFWVDLPPTAFNDWVGLSSSFHFLIRHDGAEVGVAFFGSGEPLPKPRDVAEHGMHMIDVDHISTNYPVNFKAYLHLKQNEKFYLYLRNGRHLLPEQKVRLKESRHNELYMKSVDLDNVRMFLASVFLKDTIKRRRSAA